MSGSTSDLKRDVVYYALSLDVGKSIEDIVHVTGFSYASVSKQLFLLKRAGKAGFNPDTNCYFKLPQAQVVVNGVEIQSFERPAGTSVFKYRDEAAMWERVRLLKRMRSRIIDEYHPLLDAVIADYEWMLRKEDEDE